MARPICTTPLRDTSWPIQRMRAFLLGRMETPYLRSANDLSPRTLPPPCLPAGPHDKYCCNDYFRRDARREVRPPRHIRSADKVGCLCYRPRYYQEECPKPCCPPPLCPPPPPTICDVTNPCTMKPECCKNTKRP